MPTLEALGIDLLSVTERLMLVQAILDSVVAEQPPAELSVVKQQELTRRDAELDVNPGIALTWSQIRSRIEGSR